MTTMSFTPEQCIERYMKLREAKKAYEAETKARLVEFDGSMEAIENYLLSVMLERKETQIKTVHGTAFQSPQARASLTDRAALVDYVKRTGDFNFFTNAVAKAEVLSYLEQHSVPPPGVEVTRFMQCNIRKA